MNDKQLAARKAAEQVQNGMLVGLGTGSTANYFIEELARLQKEEGLQVTTVASSVISSIKAQQLNLSVLAFEQVTQLDLYVDGADEVSHEGTLLKGRGSDLVREKILAKASERFLVLVDQSKLVNRIGEKFAIPVEVLPFAWQLVKLNLESLGATGDLRPNASKDNFAITASGSLVLDITFSPELDSFFLNDRLNAIPGVVEHGIFSNLASTVFIGNDGEVEECQIRDTN
jgi:ribose 5-phosphate isomerase A